MENEELFREIIAILQEKPMFGRTLVQGNSVDAHRMGLLQEILTDMDQKRLERSKTEIFQYGSMVGKDDLLARQIFVCLVKCQNEQERLCPELE